MSRLVIDRPANARTVIESLCGDVGRRLSANPHGNCPLETTAAVLRLCAAQSCGKCTPCRIGLKRMADLVDAILDGTADDDTLQVLQDTASTVYQTADCAIGFEAGRIALSSVKAFADEYRAHLETGRCSATFDAVPCAAACPAHVDIPAYIALVADGRPTDAVRVIRNDNPFPSACAYVCEHPCEASCRRTFVDAPVNIRGIKKVAVDAAAQAPVPQALPATGKRVAVVGGGPSGLTCAYYLRLMGHEVTVFEEKPELGGMLLYGIPRYRLPHPQLAYDIDAILSTGIEVRLNTEVGVDVSIEDLQRDFDCMFVAIGAHGAKRLGVEGEDLPGVCSAVDVLRATSGGVGDGVEMAGRDVVIIGGGNVAMDVTRTALRLGARSVRCVYRRREQDMTALTEEIDAAKAEGAEMVTLMAPVRVEARAEGRLALIAQPQIAGPYAGGRPKPVAADVDPVEIGCDVIVAAIGQDIVSDSFAAAGHGTDRKRIVTEADCAVSGTENVFSGGDCATGPATVIRAIAAGKVAAANIDGILGFAHDVHDDVEIPVAGFSAAASCGRANVPERPASERARDFDGVELQMSEQAARQECGRCLRCDAYGMGAMREGRSARW